MSDIWDNYAIGALAELAQWAMPLRRVYKETFGSPIEEVLYLAILLKLTLVSTRMPLMELPTPEREESHRGDIFLAPQWQVDQYRVDMVLGLCGEGTPQQCWIAIECDGHDFHERTKEQAQRDKARDRRLQSQAAKVLRFTGSEIYRDPFRCAAEALAAFDTAYIAWKSK